MGDGGKRLRCGDWSTGEGPGRESAGSGGSGTWRHLQAVDPSTQTLLSRSAAVR